MRSVFCYFRDDRRAIETTLDAIAQRRSSIDAWVMQEPRPALWLSVVPSKGLGLDDDDRDAIVQALGVVPECAVMIDVSGRVLGYSEVLHAVRLLLEHLEGVVQDDHSSETWTLQEVVADSQAQRPRFFLGPDAEQQGGDS